MRQGGGRTTYLDTFYPASGRRRPTRVYFARCGDYVKVGTSSNVEARLRILSAPSGRRHMSCPDDLPD